MSRNRLKAKGRRESGTFVAVPKEILESAEYAELGAHEVKLLLDTFSQFNGRNNGKLSCAWTLMRRRGWRSPDTLHRALQGLLDHGWLIRTRQGHNRICSLFAVTWKPIDDCGVELDVRPTSVAPNIWRKIKSAVREPYRSDTGAVS